MWNVVSYFIPYSSAKKVILFGLGLFLAMLLTSFSVADILDCHQQKKPMFIITSIICWLKNVMKTNNNNKKKTPNVRSKHFYSMEHWNIAPINLKWMKQDKQFFFILIHSDVKLYYANTVRIHCSTIIKYREYRCSNCFYFPLINRTMCSWNARKRITIC